MEELINELNDILSKTGVGFSVSYKKVNKNNITMSAIVIHSGSVSPVFYPDEDFMAKTRQEQIDILKEVKERYVPDLDTNVLFNPSHVMECVLPKVVGKRNIAYAKDSDLYFSIYLDMLVEYYVPLHDFPRDGCVGAYTITRDYLRRFCMNGRDLHKAAIANLGHSVKMLRLCDILKDSFGIDCGLIDNHMVVVTNEDMFYGAAAILRTDILSKIGDEIGEPFLILPSSVHELILLPAGVITDLSFVKAMVVEVNNTEVEVTDKLTDSVYIFENGLISVYN